MSANSELIDVLLINNKKGNYHLGKMFYDTMKKKNPREILQIDAATGQEETNGSVLVRSIKLARAFRNYGLKPGDVLALGGRNHLDLHIPYYAALMEGLPIVGVDPYFKHDEIKNLFKIADPSIAFCQQQSKEAYESAAQELSIKTKVVTFDGDCTLAEFIAEYGDHEDIDTYRPADFDPDKIYAWLLSSSGTTGPPKVAAFKHQVIVDAALQYLKFGTAGAKTTKPNLCLSPPQWISAYWAALSSPLLNQIKLQTSIPDDLGHIVDVINKYRPASAMTGPSMMMQLLKHEPPCDLTCFDSLILTGAKAYKELLVDIKARIRPDCMLTEAYAQSETLGACLKPNPRGPIGNCGIHIPGHGREIKLVNPETGTEITEPNVPGELWTKGPSFTEYYRNPEETAKAFTADGWYKTGDLLYRDEHNNYYFLERVKMLIKYRNYHINPNELEEVIMRLPGVAEVCVVGLAHPEDSEQPVACVAKQPGATLSAQQVKDIVSEDQLDLARSLLPEPKAHHRDVAGKPVALQQTRDFFSSGTSRQSLLASSPYLSESSSFIGFQQLRASATLPPCSEAPPITT